jgi:hypothetical protein
MEKKKKSQAEYQRDKLAQKADYRRGLASDRSQIFDAGLASRPQASANRFAKKPQFKPSDAPSSNTKGEFLVGPLKGDESRLYMRAKREAIKQARDKKKK